MKLGSLKKFKLPDKSGIYIFRDSKKRPLYIGRATSLRDRVRSYFANDLIETRGPRIIDMVSKATSVSHIETASVLEAILFESELIKKYQPYYNIDERDDKSLQYVVITDEPWPRVFLERARDLEKKLSEEGPRNQGALPYKILRKFGPYPHVGLIKDAMKILRKLFPFRDKKAYDTRHEAFYRSIGQSPRDSDENARERYVETIKYMILFFEGRRRKLRKELEQKMRTCAYEMKFEEAGQVKRLLYALDHINDIVLIKRDHEKKDVNFRMEAYDVAHLSGMENVGVMVVSVNGQLTNSEYRKFKISKNTNNDAGALKETFSRRLNHPEWQYPDLIVVDGNIIQSNVVESVLEARRISIPVVAVSKDEKHRANPDKISGNPDLIKRYKTEIIALNAEAHRFAISYHRKRRSMRQY